MLIHPHIDPSALLSTDDIYRRASRKPSKDVSVGLYLARSVRYCDPDLSFSITIGWIAVTCGTDSHGLPV